MKKSDITTGQTTARDIVRAVLPNVSDREADGILWNHTGFPSFWAGDPAKTCYKQVHRYARLVKHGLTPGDIETCYFMPLTTKNAIGYYEALKVAIDVIEGRRAFARLPVHYDETIVRLGQPDSVDMME